jgi:hypothetical protein
VTDPRRRLPLFDFEGNRINPRYCVRVDQLLGLAPRPPVSSLIVARRALAALARRGLAHALDPRFAAGFLVGILFMVLGLRLR